MLGMEGWVFVIAGRIVEWGEGLFLKGGDVYFRYEKDLLIWKGLRIDFWFSWIVSKSVNG